MRIKLKVALIAGIGLLGSLMLADGEPVAAEAGVPVYESAGATRALYRQHCAVCHGNDGRSNTKRGRETEADDLTSDDVKADSIEKIARTITNGKGEMPGFKRKLSPGQIASIARYVKTL